MTDNNLSNYINKSLKPAIADLRVLQGTAKETGNVYYYIELSFINGYKKKIFLKSDEQFAWTNAFDCIEDTDFVNF